MTTYHLTMRSENRKTGPIPTSIQSKNSCPPSCSFYKAGCYAATGFVRFTWSKVNRNLLGGTLQEFVNKIKDFPANQLWRMSVAGDLPGEGEKINHKELAQIVEANRGKRGFTYSHKTKLKSNHKAIKHANDNGLTINLSSNNLAHADKLAKLNIGPVVTILPLGAPNSGVTPEGRRWIKCVAQTKEYATCATCQLCQKKRSIIVGFESHGIQKKFVSKIAETK